jgi:hypothetical protein
MRKADDSYELAASDLVGYLNCRHLFALERAVAKGGLTKPYMSDPFLNTLCRVVFSTNKTMLTT